jgi:plastocyanin
MLVALFVLLMASPAVATNQAVTAANFSFTQKNVTISPGQKVTWTNPDGGTHNVHFEDGLFDVPSMPSSSWPATVERTFNQPGTYLYYCELHGGPGGVGMSGSVVVALPSSSASSPATSSSTSFTVGYTTTDPSGSGLSEVELWVETPGAGSYSLAATDATPASPSFTYTAAGGDGVYRFYTRARDNDGNYEDAPASAPDSTTQVQTTFPGVPPPNPLLSSPSGSDTSAPQMGIARRRIRVPSNGIVRVGLTCPASEAGGCSGTLALETRSKVRVAKVRKRKVKLGRSSFQIGGGKKKVVAIRLSRKNRRLLTRLRKVRVLATVQAQDPSGNSDTSKKTLTLTAGAR